ncbi:MAG: hypothetical protein IT371_31955 [Deltaproteobacteria bacterium]|nr:hypothetical protein [Deltaproteobacteria bacterium]
MTELNRPTTCSAEEQKGTLRALGALVPDRAGRFDSTGAGRAEADWLEALLMPPSRVARGSAALRAIADARYTVALMRAIAGTGHPDAAAALLHFAFRHQGAYRDECGRLLRGMGDRAVPALVRARATTDPLAYKITRYAAYQLDRMNRARPELALQQTDPVLLAAILMAYGEVRDPAAVDGVVKLVDSPTREVRQAARWATLRYVTGAPPKEEKRRLKLPGGKKTDDEQALYMTYRQLAHHALAARLLEEEPATPRRSATPAAGEERLRHLKRDYGPRELAERLFRLQDQRREERQRGEYLRAEAMVRGGRLEPALARFGELLANAPDHPQAPHMARIFGKRGTELLEARRYDEAVHLLTVALHLLPEGRARDLMKARRAMAEALRDRAQGGRGEWQSRAAALLAPGQASDEKAIYERMAARRRWSILLGGALAVALTVVFWALRVGRRRRDLT